MAIQVDDFQVSIRRGGRLLVAEDDSFFRLILARRLRAAGHDVVLTANGQEAWDLIRAEPPELVISDWMMPEMDGVELCRRVKQESRLRSIYFILLTAKDRMEDKISALDLGADDYLLKPCDDGELLARVRRGLRHHRTHVSLEDVSLTDALTGLRNRRYFDQRLMQEVAGARRDGRPLSLVLVDLDLFKDVNDRFGHPIGDAVLAVTARMLRDRIRAADLAARIGGDEFALILPNTGAKGALELARGVEENFKRLRVDCDESDSISIAGSAGSATLGDEMDAAGLLRAADLALYARKEERAKVGS